MAILLLQNILTTVVPSTSNETGEAITEPTEEVQNEIDSLKEKVDKQLAVSDQINNGDLLRFYTNSGLDPIDTSDYDYKNGLEKLKEAEKSLGDKSTSVFSQHNRQSTVDLYKTRTFKNFTERPQVLPNDKTNLKGAATNILSQLSHNLLQKARGFLVLVLIRDFTKRNFILYSYSFFILFIEVKSMKIIAMLLLD